MKPRYILVYMTAKDGAQASRIGRKLVEERIAACVNILGGIRSIYQWKGRLSDEREVAFIAKTRGDLLDTLTARVRELHSYECPCIIALPVIAGNPEFLAWIGCETKSAKCPQVQSSRRPPPSKPARKRK
jgi:periplasmic divalent cation tolerance protein